MKKYKHKATGKTCTEKDTFYYIDSEGNLPKWVVENSNDWEELIEKEYEILSFRTPKNEKLYVGRSTLGTWYIYSDVAGRNFDRDDDWMIKNGYTIESIKRLSDGEVFTVGDKLVLDKYMEGREYITIDSIYYNEHKQLSFRTNIKPVPCTFVFGLSDINCKKYKQPLFVTEDGKGAFEGDKMFYVDIDETEYPYSWTPIQTTINKKQTFRGRKDGDLYLFSTKEAAEKWVEYNKPIYSKNDIEKLFNIKL